ncbi:MAG: Gfo/Idh/MocA family oxidoreductase [Planctomycetales bacterium]|nr:Gfo/Idh/MocA family oxidoreductase [Planctomycetales bacterium]
MLDELANISYLPQLPQAYAPGIALIGCGGISQEHLRAYKSAGFRLLVLCDKIIERAQQQAAAYFPKAKITDDFQEVLNDDRIEVVDVATHPADRPTIISAALRAGKHVLSQKPFVLDLDQGLELIELADSRKLQLAVNQNGRWAPHFSFTRGLVQSGLIGEVCAAHLSCHWDHTWVRGTEFEKIRHLILYDYAIHWFDIVRTFFPRQAAQKVYAATNRVVGQTLMPDLLAHACIEFENGQATLAFDAGLKHGSHDRTFVSGTLGTCHSQGVDIQNQQLQVATCQGTWTPKLDGKWFPDGFRGTMGELLCAIESGRESTISARDNLQSLELCFAAIASADSGMPVKPGNVRRIPAS